MSFFDKIPILITQEYYDMWKRGHNADRFRCYLCGHELEVGERFRVLSMNEYFFDEKGKECGMINCLVCGHCDTGDDKQIIQQWKERHEEYYSVKFWALRNEDE